MQLMVFQFNLHEFQHFSFVLQEQDFFASDHTFCIAWINDFHDKSCPRIQKQIL